MLCGPRRLSSALGQCVCAVAPRCLNLFVCDPQEIQDRLRGVSLDEYLVGPQFIQEGRQDVLVAKIIHCQREQEQDYQDPLGKNRQAAVDGEAKGFLA